MSRLTKTSLLLAFFFALDKIAALLRQIIIARQFGLSAELDSFNVANNLPDMLFALISGGALAIAFIPVLSEVLSRQGRNAAWELFSRIANLAFLVTGLLAIVIAVLADSLVRWELGVAPGFGPEQQGLVVMLMRMNLIATLICSISGLIMAGLQANQHFLLPAMAPLLYNIGQIIAVGSPLKKGMFLGKQLPAFGLKLMGCIWRDPRGGFTTGDTDPWFDQIQVPMGGGVWASTPGCSKGDQSAWAAPDHHVIYPTHFYRS